MDPSYQEIGEYFLRNFQNLFKTTRPTYPKDLEGLFEKIIEEQENESLIQIPTKEEIFSILKIMPSLKAPRPYDMSAIY